MVAASPVWLAIAGGRSGSSCGCRQGCGDERFAYFSGHSPPVYPSLTAAPGWAAAHAKAKALVARMSLQEKVSLTGCSGGVAAIERR
ncbi:hypothetical protein E4U41_002089, partial [Claviceps citrina]